MATATKTMWNESQFQGAPLRHSMCGPNALAMSESYESQGYVNTLDVCNRMLAAKRCNSDGASTISELRDQAVADGYKAQIVNYTDAGIAEATWRQFLGYHLGRGAAVICETLEGCQLRGFVGKQPEDATLTGPDRLQRHFFALYQANTAASLPLFPGVTNLPHGYVVSDGCNNLMNPVVNGVRTRVIGADKHRMDYYDYAVVRASRPAALLAIYPKPAPVVVSTPAPAPQPVVTVAQLQSQVVALQAQVAQLTAVIASVRNAVK